MYQSTIYFSIYIQNDLKIDYKLFFVQVLYKLKIELVTKLSITLYPK